ncbi:PH domain-containing protein [Psychromicrobium xiongbiense]|uniref:PH domain-containing protein n=1 Tax=Psychromicrobium xiongbiense TaxID=3051184 RepID=UPI002554740A|nr:PH domain-containing protein [Psychromicrobium sp. YIM S02556]
MNPSLSRSHAGPSRPAAQPIDPDDVVWSRIAPAFVTVRLLREGLTSLLMLAVLSIPVVLVLTRVWAAIPPLLAWLVVGVAVIVRLWRLLLVPRQVAAVGYAERAEDLLIRQGLFFQRLVVIPYGRMQYVDVSVGPLERMFGVATLKLHTASPGTRAHLEGLPVEQAARLREQLSALGEARLAGL